MKPEYRFLKPSSTQVYVRPPECRPVLRLSDAILKVLTCPMTVDDLRLIVGGNPTQLTVSLTTLQKKGKVKLAGQEWERI